MKSVRKVAIFNQNEICYVVNEVKSVMGVSTKIKSSMEVGTEVKSAKQAVTEKQNQCLEVVI